MGVVLTGSAHTGSASKEGEREGGREGGGEGGREGRAMDST